MRKGDEGMASIVLHKPSQTRYLLLGTGFGAYQSERSSFWGGDLFPHKTSGEIPVAAVCDAQGTIHWFLTEELQVIEINGIHIGDWAAKLNAEEPHDAMKQTDSRSTYDRCPACQCLISVTDQECPSCGLAFIEEEDPKA